MDFESGGCAMKIAYPVRVWFEDGVHMIQGLPPMDNVMTFGETVPEALDHAREALTGVLGALLDRGLPLPDPVSVPAADGVYLVEPEPTVAIPILLRKAREAAGLTQAELANRLGVTYQAVQKWERSGANPTVATIQRVFQALGRRLELELV